MGILLAFMFLVNMLGAILLLPALAAYLYAGADNRVGAGKTRRAKKASTTGKTAKASAATVLVAVLAGAMMLPSDAGAALSAADVERLGKDLTPVGAARGANPTEPYGVDRGLTTPRRAGSPRRVTPIRLPPTRCCSRSAPPTSRSTSIICRRAWWRC